MRNFKIGVDSDANGRFNYGLVTKLPPQQIPIGAAADSLNWVTIKGRIELVRGYAPLGTEASGSGRITGLIVGTKNDGTQIPFRTEGKKAKYYDSVTDTWIEIGTDMLGTAADGEDITFAKFQPRSGSQVWLNSPNSGPKKIVVANPGDYSDMYDSSKNYKSHIFINQNRAYNINIENKDNNIVRLSYEEVRGLADYTQIVAESVGTGNGVSTTFTGTLAFKAAGTKRSALDVSFTDSVETFSDTTNGTLTGSLGGSGTINYTTGAFSLTFASPVANLGAITATYRWVDETASGGIANFLVPGSRVSGDPNVFQQYTGGDAKSIFFLKEHRFCAHVNAIYDLSISLDDTDATNLLWREKFGVSSLRGGYETPEGIYTVNTNDISNPEFVVIGFYNNSTEITPKAISDNLELTSYNFDDLVVFVFNDYVLYVCRSSSSPVNDTTFVYHRIFKFWDKLDYAFTVADTYNGTLIGGDTISNNVYTYFSGYDFDGAEGLNYWKSGIMKLGIKNLKKVKKVRLVGDIGTGSDKKVRLFASFDRGAFVEIVDKDGNSIIESDGDYVDKTQRVIIGAPTLGRREIGGGSSGVEAYHYERIIDFNQGEFAEVQFMIDSPGVGYASVTLLDLHDIRIYQDKSARKYRVR